MTKTLLRRDFLKQHVVATAATALGMAAGTGPTRAGENVPKKAGTILNYNENMEYRRGGRTELMFSAISLGGHWKRLNHLFPDLFPPAGWLRIDPGNEDFLANRREVVARAMDRGINYIDISTVHEAVVYAPLLKEKRDKMYISFADPLAGLSTLAFKSAHERHLGHPLAPGWHTKKLREMLVANLKRTGLEYFDVWRAAMHFRSSHHSANEIEELVAALDWAKKEGLVRFNGVESQDRPHLTWIIQKYPEVIDVVCTPYRAVPRSSKNTAADNRTIEDGPLGAIRESITGGRNELLWSAIREQDVAFIATNPYQSSLLFKGLSTPDDPFRKEDDLVAQRTLRAVLMNSAVASTAPGLLYPGQVDVAADAVLKRREFDVNA